MADYTDLINKLPLSELAAKLGATEAEVSNAASAAIPALIGGMRENAKDPAGAASLGSALEDHKGSNVLTGGVNISDIDERDGSKIVENVFGDKTAEVQNQMSGFLGGPLVSRLLPMLAPIVMSWIAGQVTGGRTAPATQAQEKGGGFLGGIIDKITGKDEEPAKPSQPDLADILGGMLGGGGASSANGGAIADILGGLLGGGRR